MLEVDVGCRKLDVEMKMEVGSGCGKLDVV